jgi:deoxyribonuclease V
MSGLFWMGPRRIRSIDPERLKIMQFKSLHSWDLAPKEAVALQRVLAGQVSLQNFIAAPIRLVAGVDVSYQRRAVRFYAAVVVHDYESMEIVETAVAAGRVDFPYVPGLLSFRELPVLLQAFRKLSAVPDVILADAQGVAHPRRLGLASHLGLWLDLPTIGCAKSLLCGVAAEPRLERGAWTALHDADEIVGRMLRTKDRVRPLIISPGHKTDLQKASEIVLHCGRGYRLPEPIRQAHLLGNRIRLEAEERGEQ